MQNRIKIREKRLQLLYLCVLFIVFGITRLWQLPTLPLGIHIDEAGMAYDAWCLANWGVDRHLKSWPVYLMNFSSGQSSLYAFLCAALFRIGGFNIWLMRLPGVVFSLLTLIFGMKLARRIWPDNVYPALFVGSLVVIGPYFIMGSRFGLDCNLMLGASTVFLYFFLTAIQTGERWRYFMSGLTGGILLYSYVLTYIILPVFLLLCLIYVIWVKRFSLENWVLMAIPLSILAFPLILVQIVNYFDLPEMKLGIFTITKMMGYRVSEIGNPSWNNFVTALRSIFIGDRYVFDSIPGIWNLYPVTAVLFAAGLVSAIVKLCIHGRRRQYSVYVFPVLWFLIILVLACFMEVNTYRVNGVFYVVALLAIEGMWELYKITGKFLSNIRGAAPIMLVAVCGIYALCFARFGFFYYSGRYAEATYMNIADFGVPITEGIEFIEGDSELSRKITYVWERSIYYAISVRPEPGEFDVIGDSYGVWRQYWFGSLGGITDDYNYMVPHGRFEEYCEELRQAGFSEKSFEHYSVFYKKAK